MDRFGSRNTFAFEISNRDLHADLRVVNVFAAGIHLTCDDNTVYLPQFLGSLTSDLDRLISPYDDKRDSFPYPDLSPMENHSQLLAEAESYNSAYLLHRFMDWGPTADNVSMTLFRDVNMVTLPFSFWRDSHHDKEQLGQVFVATIGIDELRLTFHRAAWKLMWDWSSLKRNRDGEPSDATESR